MSEPNVSVNWNGVVYTGMASQGSKFGTGTGATADEARDAALKDLAKSPEKTAPPTPTDHTTAKP